MKRQDQLLAHMDAYAVDRETNALLLQYLGETLSSSSKIVKSKLLAIDPTTKALLVKFRNQLPWQVLDPNPEFQTLKVGGGTGSLEISEEGQVQLNDGARGLLTLRPTLQQEEIRKWLTPDGVNVGVWYGFSMPIYADDHEELFYTHRTPYRWDEMSDIQVSIVVVLSAVEDIGDNIRFQLSWEHCGCLTGNYIMPITSNNVEDEQNVVAPRNAQYSIYRFSFAIDWDIDGPDKPVKAGELLGLRLRRIDATDPDASNEVIVMDMVIEYKRDKLCEPWGGS